MGGQELGKEVFHPPEDSGVGGWVGEEVGGEGGEIEGWGVGEVVGVEEEEGGTEGG